MPCNTPGAQLYRNGEPQVYCSDCLYYGDRSLFTGYIDTNVVQCNWCEGDNIFALTKAKKEEIDATVSAELSRTFS